MKTVIVTTIAAIFLSATGPAFAAEPGDKVKISIEKWRKPGSNNIGTADITVTNDNDFAVKDIRVKCDYMSKTGGRKIETWAASHRLAEVLFDDAAAFANINTLDELRTHETR